MTDLLESKYAEAEEAFIKKDVDAIEGLMSPTFVAYMPDGTLKSRDEIIAGLRTMMEGSDVVSWTRKIEDIHVDGNVAIVVAGGDFKTIDKNGKTTDMHLVNEDEWQRQEAGWLMTASRGLPTPDKSPDVNYNRTGVGPPVH